jgi:hypothetical protein
MSQVTIEIIDVEYADVPKKSGKGTYGKLTVTHKTDEGKVEAKSVMDFATPKEVFQRLRTAIKGDCFSVICEKDDNGYWIWTEADTQTAMPTKQAPATPPSRSNYETPEERAKRQVYIIRQSSISSAVELLKGSAATPEMVITVARKFENYVMALGIEDLESDVPF